MLEKFICIEDYDSEETDLSIQKTDFIKGKIYFAEKDSESGYCMFNSENGETLFMNEDDMKYFKKN